jgi:hypothetical protein
MGVRNVQSFDGPCGKDSLGRPRRRMGDNIEMDP